MSGRDGSDAREIAARTAPEITPNMPPEIPPQIATSDATAARVAPADLHALNAAASDARSVPQTDVTASRAAALGAAATLVALVLLCVAWEAWLAPLRPGGTAFVLKALPLALALPGVLRRRLYTLQWASMLVLFYFAEGIVRGMTDHPPGNRLGWIEAALSLGFFACALAYVAPFKRAAKRTRRHRGA